MNTAFDPGACVLGIETSCDETAVGIVRGETDVLANKIHSQVRLHAPFGGVVPEIAGRSHMDRILPLLRDSLKCAGIGLSDLDAIAVTNRPGLVGCLLVGLSVAKTLSLGQGIPLIGVDHLQAHVHAAFIERPDLPLPLLSLVASGGHTSLYLVEEPGKGLLLGRTRDDAAGEALDKAAALLGLGYPGGPALEKKAQGGDPGSQRFKRPMLGPDSLDFSFSGLKTALLYHLRGPGLSREMPELQDNELSDLAASFQEAVCDTLVRKLERAIAQTGAHSLAIGGGVARNQRLRYCLMRSPAIAELELSFPPLDLCSDNGAMIAALGHRQLCLGQRDDLSLDAAPRSIARGWNRSDHGAA
ncbi:MAG: tRNA (adenosine(37)-N6)-threonylcarbamoyltransferase complex transferase subunit TsaD [Planctomycetota bacterium]|nr:MAG: tRNA (adenosine(37)-N6)-threonylcarbamoyltransferase complex transferase subunit TsaD [Planctomycetota bacterium]